MKKLAVFVEGQTEAIFVERLLQEIAGLANLKIVVFAASGGNTAERRFRQIRILDSQSNPTHYVQIMNCCADNRVKSDICHRYDGLVGAGFTYIMGIRDAYPDAKFDEIPRLRTGLALGMKTKPITVLFVLGIMEIEAWFIAEHTHFQRFDANLTPERIKTECNIDPRCDDLQQRVHPAADLDKIYHLVGKRYRKDKATVQRTVECLDSSQVYCSLPGRFEDVRNLVAAIDSFLVS